MLHGILDIGEIQVESNETLIDKRIYSEERK